MPAFSSEVFVRRWSGIVDFSTKGSLTPILVKVGAEVAADSRPETAVIVYFKQYVPRGLIDRAIIDEAVQVKIANEVFGLVVLPELVRRGPWTCFHCHSPTKMFCCSSVSDFTTKDASSLVYPYCFPVCDGNATCRAAVGSALENRTMADDGEENKSARASNRAPKENADRGVCVPCIHPFAPGTKASMRGGCMVRDTYCYCCSVI